MMDSGSNDLSTSAPLHLLGSGSNAYMPESSASASSRSTAPAKTLSRDRPMGPTAPAGSVTKAAQRLPAIDCLRQYMYCTRARSASVPHAWAPHAGEPRDCTTRRPIDSGPMLAAAAGAAVVEAGVLLPLAVAGVVRLLVKRSVSLVSRGIACGPCSSAVVCMQGKMYGTSVLCARITHDPNAYTPGHCPLAWPCTNTWASGTQTTSSGITHAPTPSQAYAHKHNKCTAHCFLELKLRLLDCSDIHLWVAQPHASTQLHAPMVLKPATHVIICTINTYKTLNP